MKYFQKIIWVALVVNCLMVIYAVTHFQVDDMTLSTGKVYAFNEGWMLVQPDGTKEEIACLPYFGECDANTTIVIENTIPEDYRGWCLSFLSADKCLQVSIDGEVVYEFGMEDQRSFGQTPGSVENFIDIPQNLKEGRIRIEMVSPYDNYAAKIGEMVAGERDTLILRLLKSNMLHIACSLILLIASVIFTLLAVMQKVSRQQTAGTEYLSIYCVIVCIYYLIETKTLSIFYGNQTLYSILVFVCLMLIPFPLVLYYAKRFTGTFQRRWNALLGVVCLNIFVQLVLQLTNRMDFMEMAPWSHGIIFLTVIVVGKTFCEIPREEKSRSIKLEMVALFSMGLGGMIDIGRMYTVQVGDMGKYSRYASTVFSCILLYVHIRKVSRGYSRKVEENARLLQHEVEYMEKKNAQLHQAKEEAEKARKEAVAANESKDRFLASMSHEIRTPINAVLGMDTMILRESKNPRIKEYAMDIQTAGQSLLSLINDILDFSRIESGKMEIVPVEYDFSSVIHDIANMIGTKAREKNLDLQVSVDSSLPSRLYGDEVRIRQILINLLNNGVKYTEKGSVQLDVKGTVQGDSVLLDFSVKDTGIGIKEEDIQKLFVEFERIEEQRNRHIEGTGLGINITTQLLELMGSHLSVESVYGNGSRFFFTLRQQVVSKEPIGNLQERIRQQAVEYSHAVTFQAPRARLLVVDDNAANRKVLCSLLKETAVQIEEAHSGEYCLELAREKQYDLIFLDHMMPEMDGIETLHRMKEEGICKDTPIVALTANAISGAREMYLSEGFDSFLSKPVIPEKLEALIQELLTPELVEPVSGNLVEREKSSAEQEEKLTRIEGIDWNYARLHLPGEDMLWDTLCDFYRSIDGQAEKLEMCFQELMDEKKDENCLTSYRIQVHTMKGSAGLVGAVSLYGMAEFLEEAAWADKMEEIQRVTPVFLERWISYKEKMKVCAEEAREGIPVEDYSVIVAYLELVKQAIEELDVDVCDQTMEQLKQYDYPEAIAEQMEQLSSAVEQLDVEQVCNLAEGIKEEIDCIKGGSL